MKRKLKSDRGFTLAELLIVVAIIGVLVAIAIPIFTSQLERSREAVDLSDVRSAYAEVMMAAITGDTSATYTKDSGQKIYQEVNGTYSITVTPLKQQKDDWQTPLPITIGGVSSSAPEPYWVGVPSAGGSCKITYHPPGSGNDEFVSFVWDKRNNSAGVDPTPGPLSPTTTPVPTPETPNSSSGDWNDIVTKAKEYPKTGNVNLVCGEVYEEGGIYYVITKKRDNESVDWVGPTKYGNTDTFVAISKTIYTSADECDKNNHTIGGIKAGDIYKTDEGVLYVAKYDMSNQNTPMNPNYNPTNWQQII